jgi:hypothetical protein
MHKVIEGGNVAVLFSPSFGSGWSTWNEDHPAILFDPTVVEYVRTDGKSMSRDDMIKYLEDTYPGIYLGSGFYDLEIEWIPQGTRFKITEYDGSESIQVEDEIETWYVA